MARGAALGQPYSEGRGSQVVLRFDAPGANQNLVIPVEGRYVLRPVSCVFTVTTDATVASRLVQIWARLAEGAQFVIDGAAVLLSASSSVRFVGSTYRSQAEWATNTDVYFPLTPIFLFPSYTYNIVVTGKQAGDTISASTFVFDRFPTQDADTSDDPY